MRQKELNMAPFFLPPFEQRVVGIWGVSVGGDHRRMQLGMMAWHRFP